MGKHQPQAQLSELEKKIEYTFQNNEYLKIALTHSSFVNEGRRHLQSNERQEFLGDAVLSIIVSDYLFSRFHMAEGDLTRLRASIVCEKSLCEFSKAIGIGEYLLLGKGELNTGGAQRPSILADAFEAVLAAIYLDGGMENAKKFVVPKVEKMLEEGSHSDTQDYKTYLQEIVQKNPQEILSYILVGESGPDHDKRFDVEVRLNSNVIGRGEGRSKKAAEQMAAKEALELMGE